MDQTLSLIQQETHEEVRHLESKPVIEVSLLHDQSCALKIGKEVKVDDIVAN